jgi:predicted ribosomally synthesized peptide with nif11-like leader
MSAQRATAFYERLAPNKRFCAQLEAAVTPEEKRGIVAHAGGDVSHDDLATIRELASVSELSGEELDKVPGGAGTDTGMASGAMVVGVIGAAAFAALV